MISPDFFVAFNSGMAMDAALWAPCVSRVLDLDVPMLCTAFDSIDMGNDSACFCAQDRTDPSLTLAVVAGATGGV